MAAYPRGEFGTILELLCETAMRRSELLNLDWSQVDLDARAIHLPDTKNERSRDVPLSMRAVSLLASRASRTGRVFSIKPDSATQAFGRARLRARAMYEADCLAKGKTPKNTFSSMSDFTTGDTRARVGFRRRVSMLSRS